MTTQNTSGEGQKTQGEGSEAGKEGTVTLEQLKADLDAEKAKTARLLEESKKYKTNFQETKQKLDQTEQEKLLKEGDVQKILQSEKEKADKLSKDLSEMKKKTVLSNIRQVVAKHAPDAYSLDDLLNQSHFKMLIESIDDENLTVDDAVAKKFVDTVYLEKPWLRKTNQNVSTANGKPQFNKETPLTLESLSEKSVSDLEKELLKRFS